MKPKIARWLCFLPGMFLSLVAVSGDIAYISGNDADTVRFNHVATNAFLKGTDLVEAISVGNEALAHTQDKQRASALRQLIATFYTFAGRYDLAAQMYPVMSQSGKIATVAKKGGVFRFEDAASAIAAMAKDRRAVFINENHGAPITRLLPIELLPMLRAEGYQYLALETLNRAEASDAHGCLHLMDKQLCQRGYARDTVDTGIYSHDPVYGVLIRRAIALGFHLVAYDEFDVGSDQARDAAEARNLADVFKKDPRAKMLVVAGFDHVAKEDTDMGAVFKRVTQIDPLSVDQTELLGGDPSLWGVGGDIPKSRASVVFKGRDVVSTRPGAMDVSVYRPPYASERSRADWLTLDGLRTAVIVPNACPSYPCLLEARRSGEPGSVPEDRIYLDREGEALLYLSPGNYVLARQTTGGTSTRTIFVRRRVPTTRPERVVVR